MMSALFMIQLAACYFMTGLIWLVQLIHYPAFRMIDEKHFVDFHARHSRALSILAGPAMIIELVTGLFLLARSGFEALWGLNLALVGAAWIFTFALSVPAHNRLARGFDAGSAARLIKTNWLRTVVWTARAALLLSVALQGP